MDATPETASSLQGLHSGPISKISVEILSTIFIFILSRNHSETAYDTTDLITISHVCAFWRNVAINLPQLWRSIELTPKSALMTRELLLRSVKSSFIDIRANCPESLFEAIADDHPGIWHRIRNFEGDLSDCLWKQLCEGAQQPGAQLQNLFLGSSFHPGYESEPRLYSSIKFKGHAPLLKKLTLRGCYVDLRSPFFVTVTELILDNLEPCLSISEFASAITYMPLLQELTLDMALLPLTRGRVPTILIPNLRSLSLEMGLAYEINALHSRLLIPESCDSKLSFSQ